MEEERARQEASSKATGEASTPSKPATQEVEMSEAGDDDELLRQALAMSMVPESSSTSTETKPPTTTTAATSTTSSTASQDVEMSDELSEEQEIALAMQMSLAQQAALSGESVDLNKVMEDPNFVNSVLMSLPGVDPNDDRIKNVLQGLKKDEKKDEDKDKK
jgi:26S proteasome regulatory subunit N10